MYFPIGWPKHLKIHYNDHSLLIHVASSYDKLFNAILSERTLGIWFCKVIIICFTFSLFYTI